MIFLFISGSLNMLVYLVLSSIEFCSEFFTDPNSNSSLELFEFESNPKFLGEFALADNKLATFSVKFLI